jgi:hypothetical protein
LAFELRVACSKIKEVFTLEGYDLGIDGTATIPIARRTKDGIRSVSHKRKPVCTPGMADGIGASATISLVEKVDGVVPHDSPRSTKSLGLVVGTRRNLSYPAPAFQVVALGNADVPAFPFPAVMRRDAVIHQVASAMTDNDRVLGKERSRPCVVAIDELVGMAKRTTEQERNKKFNTIRFH